LILKEGHSFGIPSVSRSFTIQQDAHKRDSIVFTNA